MNALTHHAFTAHAHFHQSERNAFKTYVTVTMITNDEHDHSHSIGFSRAPGQRWHYKPV